MKKSIAFLSIEINKDQESDFIIDYINGFASEYPYYDIILFNSIYNRYDINFNKFATIHINEAKFFTGPMMCFNLKNMLFLKECIGKKIFYPLKLEWMNLAKNINYQDLKSLYTSAPDHIFVPTQEYYDIFNICWKTPILLEPSNYKKVMDYVSI